MASNSAIKAAYLPSWESDFDLSSIEANLFTHIYYAFLTPNSATLKVDIDPAKAHLLKHLTSTLHAKNPPIKALFSVGGASEEDLLSLIVSSSRYRTAFIHSSIQVAREFGFDGVDLDWDAPQNPTDMTKLGHLLEELRAEVQKEARGSGRAPLLVTAAVYYSAKVAYGPPRDYPAASISKNLDWVHVMSYDYRGSWDKTATGAHAALFGPNSNKSTSSGLRSWIEVGVPPRKLVMGLPLYARTWKLKDPARSHGVGAPAVDVGPTGLWKSRGVMSYAQVVRFNEDKEAPPVYDEDTVSVYSVAGDSWVGYDDERSVAEKIRYARSLGIGGYFFGRLLVIMSGLFPKLLQSLGLSEMIKSHSSSVKTSHAYLPISRILLLYIKLFLH